MQTTPSTAPTLLTLLLLGVACSSNPSTPSGPVTTTVTVAPTGQTLAAIGQTVTLTATARDAGGNPIAGKSFAWTSSAPGVATVDPTSGLVTAVADGQATISAAVDGKSGNTVVTVQQQGTQLVFVTQPATTTAGTAFAPALRVELRDAGGTVVTQSTASVSLAISTNPAGGALAGTTTQAAVGGVATFAGVSIAKAAAGYRLSATAAAMSPAISSSFDITPGPLASLVFLVGPQAAAGPESAPITPAVQVGLRDAFANAVDGAVTLSVAAAPWPRRTLAGTLTRTSTGGVATFNDLTLDRPGPGYVLRATSGAVTRDSDPFAVSMVLTQVAAGGSNAGFWGTTCGVSGGGAYCWGINSLGQLGAGISAFSDPVPSLVLAPVPLADVSVGREHACGRTAAGAVYCWGRGTEGQLGNGATTNSNLPVLVTGSGPSGRIFSSISAGEDHTCGIITGNEAWCWGKNGDGQLGDGSNTNRSTMVKVAGTGAAPLLLAGVSTGRRHSCAVTADRRAYCWGANWSGQLGNNDNARASTNLPVQVAGSGIAPLLFGKVETDQGDFTCAMASTQAYCWGSNSSGSLGIGSTDSDVLTPSLVAAPGPLADLTTGTGGGCALDTSGAAWCWGRGAFGELGNGGTANSTVPVAVTMPTGRSFTRITSGGFYTCAIDTTGVTWCWGYGEGGRLGDGAEVTRMVPTRVIQ